MTTKRKPGIAKRNRPQRDTKGRFAAKPTFYGDPYEDFWARNSVAGVELGQRAKSKGPNLLKRFREWLGSLLISAGAFVHGDL